jgi:hypothetical protein
VALAFVVVLLGGCQVGVWTGDHDDPTVAVFGDSLTHHAEDDLEAAGTQRLLTEELAAGGWRSYVTGWTGATVPYAHQHLRWHSSIGDVVPDTVVIALGTNDLDARANPTQASIDAAGIQLAKMIDGVPCARFVAPANTSTWGLQVWWDEWTAMLEAVAASHPDGDVVHQPPIPTVSDGIHHTPDGQDQYRALLQQAADTCRP